MHFEVIYKAIPYVVYYLLHLRMQCTWRGIRHAMHYLQYYSTHAMHAMHHCTSVCPRRLATAKTNRRGFIKGRCQEQKSARAGLERIKLSTLCGDDYVQTAPLVNNTGLQYQHNQSVPVAQPLHYYYPTTPLPTSSSYYSPSHQAETSPTNQYTTKLQTTPTPTPTPTPSPTPTNPHN